MPDMGKIYSELGSGFCIVKEGKILENYLLSDFEIEWIKKLLPLIDFFPKDFELGIFEFDMNRRFGVFKIEDKFLLFPARTDNLGEIIRKKGAIYEA
ncbi:MAG: hypothetical protein PWQ22_99 [Archaeoglobaceae archaeon]|nr:hypothetical protein [Archaeoglobaceae archaeon]MDK2875689.1 hypothetical protein [Archaeoglobaceae archaeon]